MEIIFNNLKKKEELKQNKEFSPETGRLKYVPYIGIFIILISFYLSLFILFKGTICLTRLDSILDSQYHSTEDK